MKRFLLLLAVALLTSTHAYAAKNAARSPDTVLAGKVRSALHATFGTVAAEIGVTSQDGFVFLYGDVQSDSVRVKAERIAAGVPGVRAVSNELEVAPGI